MAEPQQLRIVYIEGSIGCGKSAVIEQLAARGFRTVPEPVELWTQHLRNVYGESRGQWLLPMQALALTTRVERTLSETVLCGATPIIVERSMRSDALFAADLPDMDRAAHQLLYDRYCSATGLLGPEAVMHCYLRVPPRICWERARTRDRDAERGLELSFFEELHVRHEAAFANLPGVHIVDGSGELASVAEAVERVISGVLNTAPCPNRSSIKIHAA